MNLAQDLSQRSTCRRLSVGAVIVSPTNEKVLAIGYNGNAKGLPNKCDTATPGKCGCIHAETNALVKYDPSNKESVMYVTNSTCIACAKLILNADISTIYYKYEYRDTSGIDLLQTIGITTWKY